MNTQGKLLNIYQDISPVLKREMYHSLKQKTPKRGPMDDNAVMLAVWKDVVSCGFRYVLTNLPVHFLKKIGAELKCSEAKRRHGLVGDITKHLEAVYHRDVSASFLAFNSGHMLHTFGCLNRITLYQLCQLLALKHKIPLDTVEVCHKMVDMIVENGLEVYLSSLSLRLLRRLCEEKKIYPSNFTTNNKNLLVHAFLNETNVAEAKKTYAKAKGEKRKESMPIESEEEIRAKDCKKSRTLPFTFGCYKELEEDSEDDSLETEISYVGGFFGFE